MPFFGDQNVRGLDITVNDQSLVCKLHRGTDLQKKFQTMFDRALVFRAILVNGLALDEFHHKIRQAFGRGATIQQATDIWVLQRCQNLALILEAIQNEAGALSCPHQLDRYFFSILIVGPKGAINLAHPTDADLPNELVRPEAAADQILLRSCNQRCDVGRRLIEERRAGLLVGGDQRVEF